MLVSAGSLSKPSKSVPPLRVHPARCNLPLKFRPEGTPRTVSAVCQTEAVLFARHLSSFQQSDVFTLPRTLLTALAVRAALGTECPFMRPSDKQITDYATKPLRVCLPAAGGAGCSFSHPGSPGGEWEGLSLVVRRAETRPLGPHGSQEPAAVPLGPLQNQARAL